MCKILQIPFWPLSRCNNKLDSVKNYQWFLNKTQDIAGQYRVSHDVFFQNGKTYQYAWNSSPIDGTEVVSIIEDVGRELIFSLDRELLTTPTLNLDNNQALFNYFRDVSKNSQFALPVLQILIE